MAQNNEFNDECDEYPHWAVQFLLIFFVPINPKLASSLVLLFQIPAQEAERVAAVLVEGVVHAGAYVLAQEEVARSRGCVLCIILIACCENPVTLGIHLRVLLLAVWTEYFLQE